MSSRKNRTYSAEFKLDTIMEGLQGKKSVVQICRERGIKDSLYYKWRDIFFERAADIFAKPGISDSKEKAKRTAGQDKENNRQQTVLRLSTNDISTEASRI